MSLPLKYGESISVARFAAGSYVNGDFVDGSTSTLTITATVMPLSPTEARLLREGKENAAGIVIYTETELKTASEALRTSADKVTWDGRTWDVFSAEYRTQLPGLVHWKVTAFWEDAG